MSTQTLLSLLGNTIAVVALGWKTLYDLVWNKRRFEREKVVDLIRAARAKRDRSNFTTVITFLILAASYTILIGATAMPKQRSSTTPLSRDELQRKLQNIPVDLSDQLETLDGRLKDIETYLFPPGGPTSPAEFNRKLQKLDERLTALTVQGHERDRKFQELVEIVAELKRLVRAQQAASDRGIGYMTAED